MKLIPDSLDTAKTFLAEVIDKNPRSLPKQTFILTWNAICYLNPSLHPDGCGDSDSGWPAELRPFATEAWRRFKSGTISEDELYPADATWAGIYDTRIITDQESLNRRKMLHKLTV